MNKQILLVQNCSYPPIQGTTDIYYYLREFNKYYYSILYCNHNHVHVENVRESNINFNNKIAVDLLFSVSTCMYIVKNQKDISNIVIVNPLIFSFLPLILSRIYRIKSIFNIRTGPVMSNKILRHLYIILTRFSCLLSDKVVLIHEGLNESLSLNIDKNKLIISSLGFSHENKTKKSYIKRYKFIYVGTLDKKRQLSKLIEAFNITKEKLLIVGDGNDGELLRKQANKNIEFTGTVPFDIVASYIQQSKIGVSYIPKNEVYEYQPPLKTIEYLGNGIPVLATNTAGNKLFVNNKNGILTGDSVDEIVNGINQIKNIRYSAKDMQNSVKQYRWSTLCKNLFDTIIC